MQRFKKLIRQASLQSIDSFLVRRFLKSVYQKAIYQLQHLPSDTDDFECFSEMEDESLRQRNHKQNMISLARKSNTKVFLDSYQTKN